MGGDMNSAELVSQLQAKGIELQVDGERLLFRPIDALTPDEVEALRRYKPEIIRLLRQDSRLLQHSKILRGEDKTPETPAKEEGRSGYVLDALNAKSPQPPGPPKDRSKFANAILPFPLGFGGLPEELVNQALAACEVSNMTDPVLVWLRVFRRVMDYLRKQGDAPDLHQQVQNRYHEVLHIANENTGKACTICGETQVNEPVPPAKETLPQPIEGPVISSNIPPPAEPAPAPVTPPAQPVADTPAVEHVAHEVEPQDDLEDPFSRWQREAPGVSKGHQWPISRRTSML
jgi:hypothetical protein